MRQWKKDLWKTAGCRRMLCRDKRLQTGVSGSAHGNKVIGMADRHVGLSAIFIYWKSTFVYFKIVQLYFMKNPTKKDGFLWYDKENIAKEPERI